MQELFVLPAIWFMLDTICGQYRTALPLNDRSVYLIVCNHLDCKPHQRTDCGLLGACGLHIIYLVGAVLSALALKVAG